MLCLSKKYMLSINFYLSFLAIVAFLPINLVYAEPKYGALITRCYDPTEIDMVEGASAPVKKVRKIEDGSQCVFAWMTRPVGESVKRRKTSEGASTNSFILETTAGKPKEVTSKVKVSPETHLSYYFVDYMSGIISSGVEWNATQVSSSGEEREWVLNLPGVEITTVWCKSTAINPTTVNPNYLDNIDFKEVANCLFYHYYPKKEIGILYNPIYDETDE